ncbi:hypothetical protein BGW38_005055 [Lunasporangiospora selenospora]|uniref:Bacteriophage T5 Orf172 DNA-binding domain-containing protein n=1 Tax=Lunasporangiospora selenospora TaxID=979761 RepID=A0A9P6KBL9_9FUNG|nr:hypothetical protein BGW38_005055 [Lunasporangiospora selenospora]
MTKSTASDGAATARCKAIAISTGRQCTRSGKLDGYCSEKHKQQANATNGLWGLAATGEKKESKTKKVLETLGIKKSSRADEEKEKPLPTVPVPAETATSATVATTTTTTTTISSTSSSSQKSSQETTSSTKTKKAATKSTTAAKKTSAKKTAAPKRTAKGGRKAARGNSSDEFELDSSEDYVPSGSDSDSDSNEEVDSDASSDEEVDKLTGKLSSVKINKDDPTLPPRPPQGAKGAKGKKDEKIKRMNSIFATSHGLAPPKNKAKTSTDPKSGATTTGGLWIPAPPAVKIPESTLQALAPVKDKISSSETSKTTESSLLSGAFSYRTHVHSFLKDDLDPGSKRAKMRQFVNDVQSFWHKLKKSPDSESRTSNEQSSSQERPLPEKPLPSTGAAAGSKKADQGRRGSQGSVDSVDSITKDINDLSVKSGQETEEETVPNQCHGFNGNGHRCKRKVKLDRPITKGEVIMCHNHEVSEEDEVVVHIEGQGGILLQWLDLSVWVNPGLPDYVQNKLRKAMERPVSETDKPGYIYAYQLVETRTTDTHTLFKVGRTDNIYRRMSEWSDKCGSPPRLIEVFPEQGALAPQDENDLTDSPTRQALEDEITGLRCRYAHRVERLIHIELKPLHDKDHVCACSTNHREWFKVPHQPGLKDSQQMKQAWEQVRRVIVHWMAYMERVYGPG